MWKSQNRMNVYLSPYVEEPLNSKVIKSFVPEQKIRQVFFVFRDSYVLSKWTFDVRFTHSHIMAMVQISRISNTWNHLIQARLKCYQQNVFPNIYVWRGFAIR